MFIVTETWAWLTSTLGAVSLLTWLVAAVVTLPTLTAIWAWRRVFRASHAHGATAAQIAATPPLDVMNVHRRFTLQGVEDAIDLQRRDFARRLRDELQPDMDELDAIVARFRAGLAAVTV
jgi:hypothetical protein